MKLEPGRLRSDRRRFCQSGDVRMLAARSKEPGPGMRMALAEGESEAGKC